MKHSYAVFLMAWQKHEAKRDCPDRDVPYFQALEKQARCMIDRQKSKSVDDTAADAHERGRD